MSSALPVAMDDGRFDYSFRILRVPRTHTGTLFPAQCLDLQRDTEIIKLKPRSPQRINFSHLLNRAAGYIRKAMDFCVGVVNRVGWSDPATQRATVDTINFSARTTQNSVTARRRSSACPRPAMNHTRAPCHRKISQSMTQKNQVRKAANFTTYHP